MNMSAFAMGWVGVIMGLWGSAVTFRIPARAWLGCILAGLFGWEVNYLLIQQGIIPLYSAFVGAIGLTMCSEALARAIRMPSTVFVVPAVFPLVPGMTAYNAMLSLIQGQYDAAMTSTMQALLIASGIAVGMLMGNAICRSFLNPSLQVIHDSLKHDFAISIPELNVAPQTQSEPRCDTTPPTPKKLLTRRSQLLRERRQKYQQLHRQKKST